MISALEMASAPDEKACAEVPADMIRHRRGSQTAGQRRLTEHGADIMRQTSLEGELQPLAGERVDAVGIRRGTGGGKRPST